MKKYQFGAFAVCVSADGYAAPHGWIHRAPDSVHAYKICVCNKGYEYHCRGYGSIADAYSGPHDKFFEMACIVLEELASAYCDEEEFIYLALGDGGRNGATRQRLKEVDKCIDAANEFGQELLDVSNAVGQAQSNLTSADANWLSEEVHSLIYSACENRDLCPILGDALEDAGCTDEDILQELRSGEWWVAFWLLKVIS